MPSARRADRAAPADRDGSAEAGRAPGSGADPGASSGSQFVHPQPLTLGHCCETTVSAAFCWAMLGNVSVADGAGGSAL